jgi:hypothetical protein
MQQNASDKDKRYTLGVNQEIDDPIEAKKSR